MRAAVLAEPGRSKVERVERPEPRAGEALIRLEGCGVCASNLAPWEGAPWFHYPFPAGSPGHEGWGVVEAVGPGADGALVGQRVSTLSDRAFAAHVSAPADQLVVLPRALDGRPFPGEPLGCAMNIFERSEIRAGDTVAIVGIGFLGALLVQLAKAAGARVIAVSRREYSRSIAAESGADETVPFGEPWEVEGKVQELTDGALCDRVIECTGKQKALDVVGKLTRVRGRLVIAGFHQGGPRTVDMQLWNWRGLDVINAHERDPERYLEGIRAAVAAVQAGRMDPFPLLTHEFALEELGAALTATAAREEGFVKALVRP
ncbi:MAG: zinc-binding dehydrogenase [Gemmatimonadetes bacterium]|nr:zinc-binding dehydrogenase [Gemmatimonadota bacterium]